MYNKSKKSEVATRIKKASSCVALHALRACAHAGARTFFLQVMVAVAAAKAGGGEAAAGTIETLLREAYKTIDMAASKGILKKNTAARRKALVANARNSVTATA